MFSLPSIPTDSFYKFCFVSGIILMLFSGFLLYSSNKMKFQSKMDAEQIKLDFERDSSLASNKAVSDSVVNARRVKSTDSKVANKQVQVTHTPNLEYLVKLDSIYTQINRSNALANDSGVQLTFSFALLVIGTIMMVYGGHTWHRKVQLIQDELLNVQLQTSQIELQLAQLNLTKLKNTLSVPEEVSTVNNN
jgi:hypothetical protein